jgi:isopentenyl-diphosphate delta-isomerase
MIQANRPEAVSFDHEPLILVDANDQEVGVASKVSCHDGAGRLHRAFSVFIFNQHGELLLQQRSAEKRLWPLYWSNSCCSHPRQGETMARAMLRRVREELGIEVAPEFLFKFEYQAGYGSSGSEHELCSVFAAKSGTAPSAHPLEIAAWKYVAVDELEHALNEHPEQYTPWLHLEWRQISAEHWEKIQALRCL